MASHNKRPVHKAVLSLLQRLPRIRITDSNIAGQNVTIGGCQLVLNISVYVGIAILLSVVVLVIASHWSTPPQNTLSAPVPVQNVVSEQASIQAITADKMRFWLATDMGLYRYELSNGRTEFFEGNYTAVAVSPDGKKMWFSQANGTVGWYENAVTVPTRLTPPVDHNRVLSIQPDTNGDVFFGDMVSGVFRYTA